MRCRARTDSGRLVNLEIIGLPVETEDGGTTQVMGLVMPLGDPDLLRGEPLVSFELTSVRIIWTEPVPGQPKSPEEAEAKPLRHLQVIDGGLAH
jgi:hypothetical protein